MRNYYIEKNKKLIKDDLKSLLIYYNYFSPGIILPIYFDYRIIRRVSHIVLKSIIIIAYYTKLYRLRYVAIALEEDAIIILKGEGIQKNSIKLVQKNNELKVIKHISDRKSYIKEKEFYEKYKSNNTLIKLPKCKFFKGNKIEIEFLKLKTFQRLILEGNVGLEESLVHFNKIKRELILLYGNRQTLIHGDLCLINIFIDRDRYYLIDFTDAQFNNYKFDLYVLMFSILLSFKHIKTNIRSIANNTLNSKNILDILDLDKKSFEIIESKYRHLREIYSGGKIL